MLRGELIFFAVALAASVAAVIVPEGGAIWAAAKAIFIVAFILFAVALVGRQLTGRKRFGPRSRFPREGAKFRPAERSSGLRGIRSGS